MKIADFEIGKCVREDAAFQWLQARNTNSDEKVILQILRKEAGLNTSGIAQLRDDMRDLQISLQSRWKGRHLLVPKAIQSHPPDYPIIIVYEDFLANQTALDRSNSKLTLEELERWCESAVESIHGVNQKSIHGFLVGESFILIDGIPWLGYFGYATLLKEGKRQFASGMEGFLAPEVMRSPPQVTTAGDIYCFAKTLAKMEPRFKREEWYDKATDPDPLKRYSNIRQMGDEIKKSLGRLIKVEPPPSTQPSTPTQPTDQPTGSDVSIVAKRELRITVQPEGAGSTTGAGKHMSGDKVKISASPKAGYRFERWIGGGVSGGQNPKELKLERDESVTAVFVKMHSIKVEVIPPQAGTPPGEKEYDEGTTVSIEVQAKPGWRFRTWQSGAPQGRERENPVTFRLNGGGAAMVMRAKFVPEGSGDSRIPRNLLRAVGRPSVVLPGCGSLTAVEALWATNVLPHEAGLIAAMVCVLVTTGIAVTCYVFDSDET